MASQEPPSPRTRVLVVEDQPTVSQIIAEVLEANGHEVETAANGLLSRFLFASGTADQSVYRRFLAESPVPILVKAFALTDLQQLTRQVLSTPGPGPERA